MFVQDTVVAILLMLLHTTLRIAQKYHLHFADKENRESSVLDWSVIAQDQ